MCRLVSYIILVAFITTPIKMAWAEVIVDRTMAFYNPSVKAAIPPGKNVIEPIYTAGPGTKINVEIGVSGVFTDIVPLICDEDNLQKYLADQSAKCWGGQVGHGRMSLSANTYSNSPHYLVLHNPADLLKPFNTKKVEAIIRIEHTLSEHNRQDLTDKISLVYQGLNGLFDIQDFDINIKPCGEVNAFSNTDGGDITICTEVIGESLFRENGDIFAGVFLHELGHTVLNLWGLPNWNNERTADEFAAVMLLIGNHGKVDNIRAWTDFFDANPKNVARQAEGIIQAGGPHPLDIQRIRFLEEIANNPLEVVRRWNAVLYPHMKTGALLEIVNGQIDLYGRDPILAQKILDGRDG
jgi:Putative metallopeptidase